MKISSTDYVENPEKTAQYASICVSEKGWPNEIVEIENGFRLIVDMENEKIACDFLQKQS